MKTLQKFICSLLSLSLLLSISNVAAANVESSFSGKIEVDSTSESIDLTNKYRIWTPAFGRHTVRRLTPAERSCFLAGAAS